jgi:Planctomycete cytochrome C
VPGWIQIRYSAVMRRLFVVSTLAVLACTAGCPSTPPPECKVADTDCAPGYVPTFTNVYNNSIKEGCGSTRSNCHSASNQAGSLSFETQDVAYAALLDATKRHVVPGDPGCSELIVRVDSPGEDYQMPPGDPLSAPARCALIQWVLQGANP